MKVTNSMPSYSFTQSVLDTSLLLQYVQKTLPSAQSASYDGTTVKITTSTTLTAPETTTLTTLMSTYADPVTSRMDSNMNVSIYNGTKVALGTSAAYTGTWEDVGRYSSMTVSGLSDQASAAAGLSVQFGLVNAQADIVKTYTTSANTAYSHAIQLGGRYMRVVYTNGAVAQTAFSLQVKWSVNQVVTTVTGSDVVNDVLSAQLIRSIVVGKQDNGTYSNTRIDEDGRLRVRPYSTSNGSTSGATPIVQNHYVYSVNPDTNTTALTGSGAVTNALSRALVASGNAITSSATLATRRFASCPAGQTLRVVVACTFTAGVVGNTQIAGFGTTLNGLFWGYNGTSFGIMVRTDGVDTWVASSSFNVDKLTGIGSSAVTIDPMKGNTYIIVTDAVGYGGASFGVMSSTASSIAEPIVAHRVSFANTATVVGLRNPVGPVMAASTNTTNATSVIVGVSTLSAVLDNPPKRIGSVRGADGTRSIEFMAYLPVLTLLNRTTYNTVNNTTSIYLNSVSVAIDGTKGTVLIAIYDTATLTGAVYADVSTATSVVQTDTSGTALTGGILLHCFPVYNTGNVVMDLTPYNIVLAPGSSVTIAAKNTVAQISNLVSVACNWTEEA